MSVIKVGKLTVLHVAGALSTSHKAVAIALCSQNSNKTTTEGKSVSLVTHLVHNGDMKGVSSKCCQAASPTGSPVSLPFSRETPCPVADKTAVEVKLEGTSGKHRWCCPTPSSIAILQRSPRQEWLHIEEDAILCFSFAVFIYFFTE